MRRRVEDNVDPNVAARELKLGPGGLRDIEFSVQLLQLVHGRSDVLLRSSNTIDALRALATWGYVGREESMKLEQSYRFLRTLEHHLQLRQLRRTHTLPDDPHELLTLARSIGIKSDPVETLLKQWREHAKDVRRIHEKLFYRPLLNAVAGLDASDARLTTAAARDRLRALGFTDPEGALRHIESLSSGVSRRAIIQRTLLPVMLSWFAEAPYPDVGLLAFRQVSDQVGSSHWYLRLLRDESLAAERLAHILASSRYLTDLIRRAPESIAMLANDEDLQPLDLSAELRAIAQRHDQPDRAVKAIRAMRRRELFRIGSAAALGLADIEAIGLALSHLTDATISGALAAVTPGDPLCRIAIIAMGRYGGNELGFGSDADVMFIYEPIAGADPEEAGKQAFKIINDMRALLSAPADEPALDIDADLRPEGKQGPLVRSLESTTAYYAKWSSPWEAQALLRARFAAGDSELGSAFIHMINPLRYPAGGIDPSALIEMRRLKARMEAERLPRGADPTRHTKLGRGGLSDVEWVAQLLQLQYAYEYPELQTTATIAALRAEESAGLIDISDIETLITAWTLASEIRNSIMLVKSTMSDLLPADYMELSAVTYLMGYRSDKAGELEEDYLRATRRARSVMERVFYGNE
jgi:glutamate-ammonia-ligase adenylyltransferase